MRPLHLVIADVNRLLGIERVAGVLNVSPGACYKAAEDPDISGKPLSVEKLRKLTLLIANNADPAAQRLADELVCFWIPPNRMVVRKDFVAAIQRDFERLFRGDPVEVVPAETLLLCNDCSDPLQIIRRQDGSFRYVCRGCEVGGHHG